MTYSTFELSMMRLLVLGLLFADRISSPLLLKFDDDGDKLVMMMIMTLMMMMDDDGEDRFGAFQRLADRI